MPETSLETHVMKCSKKYDDYPRVDGNNTTTVEDSKQFFIIALCRAKKENEQTS